MWEIQHWNPKPACISILSKLLFLNGVENDKDFAHVQAGLQIERPTWLPEYAWAG